MNATARINVPRLIRLTTIACALAACALVATGFRPRFDELRNVVTERERQLRADEVSFAELARLHRQRPELAARYAAAFRANAPAVFLRELAWILRRHGVTLTSTTVAPEPSRKVSAEGYRSAFVASQLNIELYGNYRSIVAAIGDLSSGTELVRVGSPSLHRAGALLEAIVPLSVYEPTLSPIASPLEGEKL